MKKMLIATLLVIMSFSLNGQQPMFKALFMFNFAKYIEWPNHESQKEFIIGIYGNDDIVPELKKLAASKKINNKSIIVKVVKNPADAPNANIFYLPTNNSGKISEVTAFFKDKPTLIISDKAGLCTKGSGINYITQGGKMKFEVKKTNISTHKLRIDPKLISLGIEIK